MTSVSFKPLRSKRCPINHHGKNVKDINRFFRTALPLYTSHVYDELNLTYRRLARFSAIIENSAPRFLKRGLVPVNQTFEDLIFTLPLYQHVEACEQQVIAWCDWQSEQNSWDTKMQSEETPFVGKVDLESVAWSTAFRSSLGVESFKDSYAEMTEVLSSYLPSIAGDRSLVRIIEATFEFVVQLTHLRALKRCDLTAMLNSICRQYLRAALGYSFMELAGKMVALFADFLDAHLQSDDDDLGVNPFAIIQNLFSSWEMYKDHPFVLRLRSLLQKAIALAILPSWGIKFHEFLYTKAETELLKRQPVSKAGFVGSLLEAVSWIGERLINVYQTGSWNSFLLNGRDFVAWADACYKVKELSFQLYDPESCGFEYNEYVGQVEQCVETGENILAHASNLKPNERATVKRLLSDVRLLRSDILSSSKACEMRAAPFPTLLYGGSSLGKSSITAILESYFAKLFNLPNTAQYKYTRSCQEKHWNNFKSHAIFVILDDISAKNPNMEADLSMTEIIQMLNIISYMPEQAALDGKGKTPFRAQFVTGTTNIKHLNAHVYYNSTLAIRRRFPLITTVVVKPEYAKLVDGQIPEPYDRMLDGDKVPDAPLGEPQDLWIFKVEKVVAAQTQENVPQGAETRVVADNLNIYQWLRLMGQEATKHRENQARMLAVQRGYDAMDVCPHCFNVASHCPCCLECISLGSLCEGCKEPVMQSQDYTLEICVGLGLIAFTVMWISCAIYFAFSKLQNLYAVASQQAVPALVKQASAAVQEEMPQVVGSALGSLRAQTIGSMSSRVDSALSSVKTRAKAGVISGLSYLERLQLERAQVTAKLFEIGERLRGLLVPKAILALLSCLPLIAGVSLLWKTFFSKEPQGTDVPGKRIDANDEKANVWHCDDYIPSAMEAGSKSRSWKALDIESVNKRILNNVDYVRAVYTNNQGEMKARDSRVLALGGQLYVTTNHCMPEHGRVMLDIVSMSRATQISRNVKVVLEQSDFVRFPERDLVFFQLKNLPPRVDLKDCLPSETFQAVSPGYFLSRNQDGSDRCVPVRNVRRIERYIHQLDRNISSWSYNIQETTLNGDCGSPIIAQTHFGPHIVALHQMEQTFTQNASGPMLTRELVTKVVDVTSSKLSTLQSNAPILLDARDAEIHLMPLHHKSPFRYISEGSATVYGSVPVSRSSYKSEVVDTAIRSAVEARGYVCEVGPPCMKGWEPWSHAIKDIVQQTFVAEQSVIDQCVDAFSHEILRNLPKSQLRDIVVLEDLAVVNGLPGVRFIDKMKRNTSMGFPYNKKKTFFLSKPRPVDIWQDCVDFDDKFYTRVQTIIDRYRSGERHMPVFMGHLKDEPTKLQKIRDKKTRVFLGGPADWAFVVRKYLLGFVRVVQNNKYVFEAAPGTNATSPEWERLYKYLTHFGEDNMVAGDFSKFDKRMSAQWILAAFQVIENIWRQSPHWEEEYANIIRGIATDTAFPLCNMNGDLVQFWGSNPSGHPLTVIINSIVNALYMRYAWVKSGHELGIFKKHVHLMTYGDDNVMGIDPKMWTFNHTTIRDELGKIGVVYTMADKERESVPRIHISEISFLKRYWRWEPELGQHVAQLEEASIAKSLTKCLKSKSICLEAQAIATMTSAVHEYFMYGRSIFEEKRQMFLDIIEECDLGVYYEHPFPTFDVLKTQYLASDPFEDSD